MPSWLSPEMESASALLGLTLAAGAALAGLIAALVVPRKLRQFLRWKPSFATLIAGALLGGLTLWQAAEVLAGFEHALHVARLDAELRARHFPGVDLVTTAPPDPRYNCHGWVFADGDRNVSDGDVEVILTAGRYQAITWPSAGDLVVYRTTAGVIVHTGIVYDVADAGVLVESKWGHLSRFIHPVQAQDYDGVPSYYRLSSASAAR